MSMLHLAHWQVDGAHFLISVHEQVAHLKKFPKCTLETLDYVAIHFAACFYLAELRKCACDSNIPTERRRYYSLLIEPVSHLCDIIGDVIPAVVQFDTSCDILC